MITTGPRTKKLEKEIAEWIGVNKCVCLNSQTACAEMALRVLGIGPGDEVITSAYTYTASASVIDHVGAKIVMVDCLPDSFDIDYDQVDAAITEKTKAIIPIDIGGKPCDYDRLYEIVEKKRAIFKPSTDIQKAIGRVAICADCAHSFGATRNGVMAGALADFSSFSFHAVKNFTTAETQLGAWEYDIIGTWYKCNMTDVVAAIGLKQFERYPELLIERKAIFQAYENVFKLLGIEVISHYTEVWQSTGHFCISQEFLVLHRNREMRLLLKWLSRELHVMYITNHFQCIQHIRI